MKAAVVLSAATLCLLLAESATGQQARNVVMKRGDDGVVLHAKPGAVASISLESPWSQRINTSCSGKDSVDVSFQLAFLALVLHAEVADGQSKDSTIHYPILDDAWYPEVLSSRPYVESITVGGDTTFVAQIPPSEEDLRSDMRAAGVAAINADSSLSVARDRRDELLTLAREEEDRTKRSQLYSEYSVLANAVAAGFEAGITNWRLDPGNASRIERYRLKGGFTLELTRDRDAIDFLIHCPWSGFVKQNIQCSCMRQ